VSFLCTCALLIAEAFFSVEIMSKYFIRYPPLVQPPKLTNVFRPPA
jgi:hypothetical protein